MSNQAAGTLLKRAWFAGLVATVLFAAAIIGFYFGWTQVKKPLIVALTFHGVTDKPSLPWEIYPENLLSYISQLKRHDYTPLEPASLSLMLQQNYHGRHYLMTFDDGLLSSAEAIKTLYKDHGIKSVIFVVLDLIGTPGYADKQTLLDLQNNFGCLIGLHGRRHYEVSKILAEGGNLTEEIEQARTDLSAMLHSVVDWYAYPFGDFNASATACIASTGIKLAFTIEGHSILAEESHFTLPRIMYLKGAREAGEAAVENWLPPASASTGSLTITLSILVGFLGLNWLVKMLTFMRAYKTANLKAAPEKIES